MKDKKTLILIIASLTFIAGILYFNRPYPFSKTPPKKPAIPEIGIDTPKLESQVQQLKDLIRAVVALNRKLYASIQREKTERQNLEQTIQDSSQENKILSKSLLQFRAGLGLTEPLKEKVAEIENDLANIPFKVEKEKEIKNFLFEIKRKLNDLDAQLPLILKENQSYKLQADKLSLLLSQKNNEITLLKNQNTQALQEKQNLKYSLANASKDLDKAKKEYAPLEAKAAGLENVNASLKQGNSLLSQEVDRLTKDRKSNQNAQAGYTKALEDLEASRQKQNAQNNTILALQVKNQEISWELASLRKQLSNWEQERQGFTEELKDTKNAIQNNLKLHEIIDQLKLQLEEINQKYASLEKELRLIQNNLKNNEIELGRRADKILHAEEKRGEAENKTTQFQLKAQELEKDSASLREQVVTVQLEREALRNQLLQAQGRLGELEIKASQITNILKTPKTNTEKALTEPEKKDIAVDLYPLQNNSGLTSQDNPTDANEPAEQ